MKVIFAPHVVVCVIFKGGDRIQQKGYNKAYMWLGVSITRQTSMPVLNPVATKLPRTLGRSWCKLCVGLPDFHGSTDMLYGMSVIPRIGTCCLGSCSEVVLSGRLVRMLASYHSFSSSLDEKWNQGMNWKTRFGEEETDRLDFRSFSGELLFLSFPTFIIL